MTIPITKDVKITAGVLAAGGSAVDLNGLILTDSAYLPVGAVVTFSTADDVSKYFGSASQEAAMATVYFQGYDNCTKTPGKLLFGLFNTTPVASFLRSASLSDITLAQLQLLSGVIILTVDGDEISSANINLSAVTSFDNAAQVIGSAIGSAVTVRWDSIQKAFTITSATTGQGSTITAATGELATSLRFTAASGAVVSQGAAAAVVSDMFTGILSKIQDWAGFTTSFTATQDQHLALAAWVSARNKRFFYVAHDSAENATVAGSTENLAYQLLSVYAYGETVPVYGYQTHAASVLGYAAALDFSRNEGRVPLKFRSLDGLLHQVNDSDVYDALIANGYNFYGAYSSNNYSTQYWADGTITGAYKWLDAFLFQIWLNANLMQNAIQIFQSNRSIPYNTRLKAIVEASFADTIEQGKAFGGIRTGITLSGAQQLEIQNAVGTDVTAPLLSKGWYLYIKDPTPTQRSTRTSPAMTFYYCDGGSLQKLDLSSIEVE